MAYSGPMNYDAIAGTRYSDAFMAATYGTRAAYVAQLDEVIAERRADSYAKYLKRQTAGLAVMTKDAWTKRRFEAVADLVAARELNR